MNRPSQSLSNIRWSKEIVVALPNSAATAIFTGVFDAPLKVLGEWLRSWGYERLGNALTVEWETAVVWSVVGLLVFWLIRLLLILLFHVRVDPEYTGC